MRSHAHTWFELAIFARNFLVDGLCAWAPRCNRPADRVASVLLVRLDSIGDLILWQDSLKEVRALYPPDRFRLILVGNAVWSELAEKIPFLDAVIPVDRKALYRDLRYRIGLWRLLRQTVWEEVIQPVHSRETLFGDAVVRVCGAKRRIGSLGDLSNQTRLWKRVSDRWYTRLIPAGDVNRMELKRNADFLRGMGRSGFRAGLPRLDFCPQLPKHFNVKAYAVIVPGAGSALRQWPLERFAVVARRIRDTFGLSIIVCGSAGEAPLAQNLCDDPKSRAENWAGRTSLVELASIIKGARLVIGNESGAIHLAAAVGVQAICIMGGGHQGRFVPYQLEGETSLPLPIPVFHRMDCFNCGWYHCVGKVPQGGCAPCLDHVDVEEVWREIRSYLDENSDGDGKQ